MSGAFSESVIEQAALAWLESIGYSVTCGLDIAPDGASSERDNYGQVVLENRLRQTLMNFNPNSSLTARFFIILTDRELQLEKKLLAQQNLLGMLRDKLEDY